jgi:rsbT co-antagonist protein RsbR
MQSPTTLDDPTLQIRQFSRVVLYGAGVMSIFCLLSYLQLAGAYTVVGALSAATDTLMLGLLVGLQRLHRRMALSAAATLVSVAILIYSVVNLLLFPGALIRMIAGPLLAVMVPLAYVGTRTLRWLSAAAWGAMAALFWISVRGAPTEEQLIDFVALMAIAGIILAVLQQFHGRISASLVETRAANGALRVAQISLEDQVAERTEALQQALDTLQGRAEEMARLLAETESQRSTIRAMSVPVLPVGDQVLAVPLVGAFDHERLAVVQQETLAALERSQARRVVIDLTGVTLVDSGVATGVVQIARMAELVGAQTILTGIRPEVAQSLVALQLDLSSLQVAATLQEGIRQALHSTSRRLPARPTA